MRYSTVNRKVKDVPAGPTMGAVKLALAVFASARTTVGLPPVCCHKYDLIKKPGEELDPSRTTVSPSRTVWSGPASTRCARACEAATVCKKNTKNSATKKEVFACIVILTSYRV